jgi:hypothetical protein
MPRRALLLHIKGDAAAAAEALALRDIKVLAMHDEPRAGIVRAQVSAEQYDRAVADWFESERRTLPGDIVRSGTLMHVTPVDYDEGPPA